MIELTPAQARAVDQVRDWIRTGTSQSFSLAGYAGTGKTTLIRWLVEAADDTVRCCAPTGKAVAVLASKLPEGSYVTTIHSFLYQPLDVRQVDVDLARDLVDDLKKVCKTDPRFRDEYLAAVRRWRRLDKMIAKGQCDFIDRANPNYAPFVIVDEASMVDDQMEADLRRCAGRILFVGDPGQLPPIEGTDFFDRNEPDVALEEVHRQAADSTILRLATAIRLGERFGGWDESCRHVGDLSVGELVNADQIITGMNKTRRKLNRDVRRNLGYTEPYPEKGEPLGCLRNDHGLGLINGLAGLASGDAALDSLGDLRVDLVYNGRMYKSLPIDPFPFAQYADGDLKRGNEYPVKGSQFDFGYTITTHRAQGSEWPHVVIWDDKMNRPGTKKRRRWTYTAITRASERLTWVSAGG